MTDVTPPEDRIILRQSWLGDLGMCPERARQAMLGIAENTDSTSTVLGSAVHYGIEQCLLELMQTGDPLTASETVDQAMGYWHDHTADIVRWNHKPEQPPEIIEANAMVWTSGRRSVGQCRLLRTLGRWETAVHRKSLSSYT